ncbi:hypothetical protein [Paraburkholderia rhizosphaerae]|uniref:hypothetical protein n=1 Tax=Paraburkholderia rhizosphaerae TaxID=480658 RepID=UPI001066C2D7|nr:hypothetical protein [Paraburkholderia rhizosphaerae]
MAEGNDGVAKVRKFFNSLGLNRQSAVPEAQKRAIEIFIRILQDFFYINTLGGHREFPGQLDEGKICPGNVGMKLVKDLRKSTGLSAP